MITPHEATGDLTTWADETQYWTDLATAYPDRVTITEAGRTPVKDRPLRLVRIATPATPPDARGVLVIAYVHATEPAPREYAMALARDMAETEDPYWVDYLTRHPLHIIGTVNADQIETRIRNNGNGVNINRDHLALTQPETRAIWAAIGATTPDMLIDLHEFGGHWSDVAPLPARGPGIHSGVRAVVTKWFDAGRVAVEGAGYTYGPYLLAGESTTSAQAVPLVAGIPAITPETSLMLPMADRMTAHRVLTEGLLRWHDGHSGLVRDTSAAAGRAAVAAPASGTYRWGEHSTEAGTTTLPDHYLLTGAQWAAIEQQRLLHGITGTPDGDDWIVPLLQAARQVIPLLLDPGSPYMIVEGVRVGELVPAARPASTVTAWGPYRQGGEDVPVTKVQLMAGETLVDIWP